jgi:uncharacterized protein (DUF2236 family)
VPSAEKFDPEIGIQRQSPSLTPAQSEIGKQLLFKYGGDLRLFLVVGQVAVIQLMLPAFTAVVADNSVFYADVWRRWFDRTQPYLQRAVFDEDPVPVAHQIRDIHTNLEGMDDKGRHWHALDPKVFHWAHATQYYGIWQMIQLFDGRRLTPEETEAYYQATRRVWFQFGVSDDVSPPDWPSFVEYYDSFVETWLEDTSGAHDMLEFLTHAVPPPPVHWNVPTALWRKLADPVFERYGRLCVGVMPPKAREILDLAWTDDDERWLQKIGKNVARVAHATPEGWLISPEARKARFGSDHSPNGRLQYLAGQALQSPIQAAWKHSTR